MESLQHIDNRVKVALWQSLANCTVLKIDGKWSIFIKHLMFSPIDLYCTVLPSTHSHTHSCSTPMGSTFSHIHQYPLGSQGQLGIRVWGDKDLTADVLVSGRPALPPEPQNSWRCSRHHSSPETMWCANVISRISNLHIVYWYCGRILPSWNPLLSIWSECVQSSSNNQKFNNSLSKKNMSTVSVKHFQTCSLIHFYTNFVGVFINVTHFSVASKCGRKYFQCQLQHYDGESNQKKNCVQYVLWLFSLVLVPNINTEEAGVMTYTVAGHQRAIKAHWLHFWKAVMSSIFILSLYESHKHLWAVME